ncbi:MAG: 16S rRNA (guanine(966)-N(2))-methyltransferase RsmD [Muribaculaceae bacterium]|nr:16S rRNA (guanine(966)-N(2))-methyltransferase RsmD [Muribaculaceae bacterium]
MRIISGKYGRRRFQVPHNITARPTTDMARENLFNVINNLVDYEGIKVLDLFAGTGAITFEFLSRGADHVTSVEKAGVQARFIAKVAQELGEKNLTLVRGDVFRFIASCREPFDVIFADPPYDLPQLPDIPELVLSSALVKPTTLFIMEHPRNFDFSSMPAFAQHRAYGKVNFTFFTPQSQDSQ